MTLKPPEMRTPVLHILEGLLKCESCNVPMAVTNDHGDKPDSYACLNTLTQGQNICGTPQLEAADFDQYIMEEVTEALITDKQVDELVKKIAQNAADEADKQTNTLMYNGNLLENLHHKSNGLARAVEDGTMKYGHAKESLEGVAEKRNALKAANAEAEQLLGRLRHLMADGNQVRDIAKNVSNCIEGHEENARRFLTAVVRDIIVRPGGCTISYNIPKPE